MRLRFTLDIHEEGDSMWAEVEGLPGCFAEGRDLNELMEAVQEAIGFCIEDLQPEQLRPFVDHEADTDVAPVFELGRKRVGNVPKVHSGNASVDQMRMLIEA